MAIKSDIIKQVEINDLGQLHIKPENETFILIYRTATEVHWDEKNKILYSPKPQEWTYLNWFNHIVNVAKSECLIELKLNEKTNWVNIPDKLRIEILKSSTDSF